MSRILAEEDFRYGNGVLERCMIECPPWKQMEDDRLKVYCFDIGMVLWLIQRTVLIMAGNRASWSTTMDAI